MVSKRAKRAAAAAKRIPLVGTAVVLAPALGAASAAGLNLSTIGNMENWKQFLRQLTIRYAGMDPETVGNVDSFNLARTYTPIAIYLLARRFAGKHISRVLRPLHVKF